MKIDRKSINFDGFSLNQAERFELLNTEPPAARRGLRDAAAHQRGDARQAVHVARDTGPREDIWRSACQALYRLMLS